MSATKEMEASSQALSKDNQVVKLAKSLQQKKFRNTENLFLIEGKTLIQEATKKSIPLKHVFAKDEKTLEEFKAQLAANIETHIVDNEVMEKMATTESPPPIMAIAEKCQNKIANNTGFYLFCEDIGDPGNLGSIIRTAFAAGVTKIYLSKKSVDIYNPKTLRASMGGVFYGEIIYADLEEVTQDLKKEAEANNKNLEIVGTSPRAHRNFNEVLVNPMKNILVLVGSEAHGLSKEASEKCTQIIKIPLSAGIESVNVLAATSVVLFNYGTQIKET